MRGVFVVGRLVPGEAGGPAAGPLLDSGWNPRTSESRLAFVASARRKVPLRSPVTRREIPQHGHPASPGTRLYRRCDRGLQIGWSRNCHPNEEVSIDGPPTKMSALMVPQRGRRADAPLGDARNEIQG